MSEPSLILFQKMLEQQADKDKAEAETRKQWIRYVIGPALLAVLGASGWSASNASNAAEAADQVNTDTKEDIQEQISALDRHIRASDVKHNELVDYNLRKDAATQETFDYIIKKLDKIDRRASGVAKPIGVDQGKDAAKAVREAVREGNKVDLDTLYVKEEF